MTETGRLVPGEGGKQLMCPVHQVPVSKEKNGEYWCPRGGGHQLKPRRGFRVRRARER